MGRIGVEPPGNIIPRRKPADFPLVLAYVNREPTDLRKGASASDGRGEVGVTMGSSPVQRKGLSQHTHWPELVA